MPSPEASRRNLALAKAKGRPPRLWRSPKESRIIRSLVRKWWLEQQTLPLAGRQYPVCPYYKSGYHRFRAGRCPCGYERAMVDADGYYIVAGNQHSARKLAKKLSVSHTWVLKLMREFRTNPERQARLERNWGAATLEQLREEQARRRDGPFAQYRPRRIQRPAQRPDPMKDELERRIEAVLKWQTDYVRDYGHSPDWLPDKFLSPPKPSSPQQHSKEQNESALPASSALPPDVETAIAGAPPQPDVPRPSFESDPPPKLLMDKFGRPVQVNQFGQPLEGGNYHPSFLMPWPGWARRLR